MGISKRLFGSKAQPVKKHVDHPLLGAIHMDSANSWLADEIEPLGCKGTPALSINGDVDGPDPVCVESYRELRARWSSLADEIAEDLLELNHNYFDEDPSRILKRYTEIWNTAELLSVTVEARGWFSFNYTFEWQDPDDSHEITVYVEDWKVAGTSIDG